MRRFALILLVWPGIPAADTFRPLTGAQILDALSGRTLAYDNGATQVFEPSMATQYFSGRPSSGRRAVRDDRYCSIWPPSDFFGPVTVFSRTVRGSDL